jgi:hypothetical protein
MVQRGHTFYEHQIRTQVETQHTGDFLILEVETGDYEIDAEEVRALQRAKAKHPDGALYIVRIGSPTADRFGAQPLTTAP